MAFRIFRNDALQKYNAQFELAAKYAYLAAKAYDYETALKPGDSRGPGSQYLDTIVKSATIGIIDDGYLRITDRKKNIIVTAGGKNIAPAPIEGAIIMNKFFEQALVHGDRRKFVSALIVPNYDEVSAWAKEHDIVDMTPEALSENQKVYDMLMGEIEEIMKNFSGYEAVKKIIVMPRELSIEDGTLTPTLKIKKRVVEERYKAKMDALYE